MIITHLWQEIAQIRIEIYTSDVKCPYYELLWQKHLNFNYYTI